MVCLDNKLTPSSSHFFNFLERDEKLLMYEKHSSQPSLDLRDRVSVANILFTSQPQLTEQDVHVKILNINENSLSDSVRTENKPETDNEN